MAFLANILGPSQPVTLRVLPAQDGTAWVDADKNGKIDDGDAYLVLEGREGSPQVDFQRLQSVVTAPQNDAEVAAQLGDYEGTSIVNGSMCFDMVSTFRQTQTFENNNGEVTLTLTPNSEEKESPVQSQAETGIGTISLVKDKDGVLRWEFPEPPAPPPPPEGAVKEATLVERDGILHWLWPGEVPADGDKIMGTPDTIEENLKKQG
jgi:hypothetical protein